MAPVVKQNVRVTLLLDSLDQVARETGERWR